MSYYILPCIAAIALKLIIFWRRKNTLKESNPWLWGYFLGLLVMNVSELIAFGYASRPTDGIVVLTAYYIGCELAFFSLFCLSLTTSRPLSRGLLIIISVFFILALTPLLIPGAALAGVQSIDYSITRIAGDFYFLVQLGILIPLFASFFSMIFFSIKGKTRNIKRKSIILLIHFLPIFIMAITIILLMAIGSKINAAIFMSLVITLSLWILVAIELRSHQYMFMMHIPKSKEYSFMHRSASVLTNPDLNMVQAIELLKQEMIAEALDLTDGSPSEAAEMLGVTRQTIYNRSKQAKKD